MQFSQRQICRSAAHYQRVLMRKFNGTLFLRLHHPDVADGKHGFVGEASQRPDPMIAEPTREVLDELTALSPGEDASRLQYPKAFAIERFVVSPMFLRIAVRRINAPIVTVVLGGAVVITASMQAVGNARSSLRASPLNTLLTKRSIRSPPAQTVGRYPRVGRD